MEKFNNPKQKRERILELWNKGLYIYQISERTGLPRGTIKYHLLKAGIDLTNYSEPSRFKKTEIAVLDKLNKIMPSVQEGENIPQATIERIYTELGISESQVCNVLKMHNYKTSKEQERRVDIVDLYMTGEFYTSEIAQMYSITQKTVMNILHKANGPKGEIPTGAEITKNKIIIKLMELKPDIGLGDMIDYDTVSQIAQFIDRSYKYVSRILRKQGYGVSTVATYKGKTRIKKNKSPKAKKSRREEKIMSERNNSINTTLTILKQLLGRIDTIGPANDIINEKEVENCGDTANETIAGILSESKNDQSESFENRLLRKMSSEANDLCSILMASNNMEETTDKDSKAVILSTIRYLKYFNALPKTKIDSGYIDIATQLLAKVPRIANQPTVKKIIETAQLLQDEEYTKGTAQFLKGCFETAEFKQRAFVLSFLSTILKPTELEETRENNLTNRTRSDTPSDEEFSATLTVEYIDF